MNIKEGVRHRLKAYRNPIYLVYALVGVFVFVLTAVLVASGTSSFEISIFRLFNDLSDDLYRFFWVMSLFGTIGMVCIVAAIALIRSHYANAIKIFVGGVGAYAAAYALKLLDIRPRPVSVLEDIYLREPSQSSYGFPSGHAAVATVLAITAYQYLPKRWHRAVTILAVLVCVSRLYLGVHLPLDLVGGFAIGLFFGGVVNFALGSRRFSPVSPSVIKSKLKKLGVRVKTVELAAVDARGSTPYIVKTEKGGLFVKVVGRENNVADWLFKLWRKVVYRRLEDEAPFFTAKRELEHEAYVSGLAKLAGVRTPVVIGIFEAVNDRWAHVQEAIPGKSLDKVNPGRLTEKVLRDVWQQINIMHGANIVHRDLRCANVFLDNDDNPWIIDFGFAEASMPEESKYRDSAELIGSLATLVGPKRAVQSAFASLEKKEIKSIYPYLSYSVFSSATTKSLKQNKEYLGEIRSLIISRLGIKKEKPIEMKRVSGRTLLLLAAIVLFAFFLMPKIGSFKNSFVTLREAQIWLVGLGILFSGLTYFMAGLSYKSLILYPISLSRLVLIQIAGSFTNKLAPGGAGNLALNAQFLVKNGHNKIDAGSIAGINNLMGFVSVASLLILGVLFGETSLDEVFKFDLSLSIFVWYIIAGGIFMAVVLLVGIPKLRKVINRFLKAVVKSLETYRHHPARLVGSYLASVMITLAYCGALYASVHAFGVGLSPLQILVVFTIGMAAASVTPTPGGVGGAEAGLTAALTATGVTPEIALTSTLLYRLVTYWVPIIPGFLAFRYAISKEYV